MIALDVATERGALRRLGFLVDLTRLRSGRGLSRPSPQVERAVALAAGAVLPSAERAGSSLE